MPKTGPTGERRATVKDIARLSGASLGAISAALHGNRSIRVGAAMRARIQQAAAELGYEPHRAAQLLRMKKTGQIGMIAGERNLKDAFMPPSSMFISSFVEACSKRGIRYVLDCHHHAQDDGNAADYRPPPQIAADLGMVDGVILSCDVGEPLRRWLEAKGHFFVSVLEKATHCVMDDCSKGQYEALRHLAGLGHRRVACVTGLQRYSTHRLKEEGFARAVKDFGLKDAGRYEVNVADGNPERKPVVDLLRWTTATMSRRDRPTAVICLDDRTARAVIHAATARGLAVPEDLSVVSWGPARTAAAYHPILTTVEMDFEGMVDAAVTMLQTLIAHGKVPQPELWVTPRLVLGETTAKAP